MIAAMKRRKKTVRAEWSEVEDRVIRACALDGISAGEIARLLAGIGKRRTRFAVRRRIDVLQPRPRVRARKMPGAELAPRPRPRVRMEVSPPALWVLAIPLDLADKGGWKAAVAELMDASVPGWRWWIDDSEEMMDGAIAAARHRATLRDERLSVIERDVAGLVVAFEPLGRPEPTRRAVLAVVRFARD
jgi:hypothetical protein